ncbi:DUF1178 family protein [Pseudoroseomonas globiformis]|uniref:DUF1178 family protein n=1 Tax=Teichococcus globiformis TaxID=2307229 RepID=A0ABV7G3C4_9PROT
MIHYHLLCEQDHQFDGWYKDSAAFDKLVKAGLVDCPVCSSSKVRRALMSPAIGKGRDNASPEPPPNRAGSDTAQPLAAGPMPAQMVALLQKMRAEVEKSCDYVGNSFADEARRMHRGEREPRGIYGEASDSDAEALKDEGIDVARLPWVPRADG